MKIRNKVGISLTYISQPYKIKFYQLTIIQSILPLLDILGILMLGFLVQTLLSVDEWEKQVSTIDFLGFSSNILSLGRHNFIVLLATSASILFVSKGLFASFVVSKTYKLLASASLDFSSTVARKFFSGNLTTVHSLPSARVGSGLNDSVSHQIVGILGSYTALVGESALIVAISVLLFSFNAIVTLVCISYFLFVFVVLQKSIKKTTNEVGVIRATSDLKIRILVQESIDSFRELFVVNAIEPMLKTFNLERQKSAFSQARIFWLTSLPKYIFEAVLVVGVVLVIVVNALTEDTGGTQVTVAAFLIAGVRILPSILRIQALVNAIEYSYATAIFLRDILEIDFTKDDLTSEKMHINELNHEVSANFRPEVDIKDLRFSYTSGSNFELRIDDLHFERGERIALVGSSGSGKSTFADLLLGVQKPNFGIVKISDLTPKETITFFPGQIGYVPQSPNLFSADIFGNVAIYGSKTSENIARVWECLELAQLDSVVRNLPEGIDTPIGERGFILSGGQKQRLSLARALFPNPSLIVLDEATSALDSETENSIGQVIGGLSQGVTVIVIAHRLSTVKSFNRLLYFENGNIIGDGNFDELRKKIKKFDIQASLSGY